MPSFRSGSVVEITSERPGLQRIRVSFDPAEDSQRAYNLSGLTGDVRVGDRVVCNVTAVALGLGTGGWHVVHWNLANANLELPGGGHIMKLRYTSLQADVGTAEEHDDSIGIDLGGIPVVACSLHSQVGVVAAAFATMRPHRRLAYVMTDGAALPLALSDLVHDLMERGLLCGTVTAGHAFGGTHEAVNVPSALTVARSLLGADAIVVGMGPGVVGTGTTLGNTALELTDIVHAAATLNGRAIACLRASSADERTRHRGLSHHTVTALRHVRPDTPLTIAAPRGYNVDMSALSTIGPIGEVDVPDVGAMLSAYDLTITTMGRKPADDATFFSFAAAAGCVAATMVE